MTLTSRDLSRPDVILSTLIGEIHLKNKQYVERSKQP